MGEWTWVHARFPLADIELMQEPFDARTANVLVRTIRAVPGTNEERFEVRIAPHNVAPFRGGPWIREFSRDELEDPGGALQEFRAYVYEQIPR